MFTVLVSLVAKRGSLLGIQKKATDLTTLFRRLWKVAAPYWSSDDKVQARLQLAGVFALTLATTGISVGFNFLGRDFFNALASEFLFCFIILFENALWKIKCQ